MSNEMSNVASRWRERILLVAGSIVITWSLALWSFGPLGMGLVIRVLAFIGSIVLLVGLAWLTLRWWRNAVRSIWSREMGWPKATIATALSLLIFIPFFLTVAFILNEGVGADWRAASFLSLLPDGNLLMAGGRSGWVYFGGLVALVYVVFWAKINRWFTTRVASLRGSLNRSNRAERPVRSPKPVRAERRPAEEPDLVPQEDTMEHLGSMFAN